MSGILIVAGRIMLSLKEIETNLEILKGTVTLIQIIICFLKLEIQHPAFLD